MDFPTTSNDLYKFLGDRISRRVPGTHKVLRAPINRAALPIGDYAIFQPVGSSRVIHRPVQKVDKTTGIITEFQSMEQPVQVDFYGTDSDDYSRAFYSDILSAYQSAEWQAAGFGIGAPTERTLFSSFDNDEQQLEQRWTVRFSILYTQAYAQTNDAFDTVIIPKPFIADI